MSECKKILIVDDESDFNAVLGERLEYEGFVVNTATNGVAGLEMMKKDLPDVVLLDIMMPGIDGFAVLQSMRTDEKLSKVMVIFLTAYGCELSEEQKTFIGDTPFLRKPFELDVLLKMIGS